MIILTASQFRIYTWFKSTQHIDFPADIAAVSVAVGLQYSQTSQGLHALVDLGLLSRHRPAERASYVYSLQDATAMVMVKHCPRWQRDDEAENPPRTCSQMMRYGY